MKTTNFERFLMYTVLIGGMIGVWFIKDLETAYKVAMNVGSLINLACVSYLDNNFWKPEKAKVTYYLFGHEAVKLYHESVTKIEMLNKLSNSVEFSVYAHQYSDSACNLIDEYEGWTDYCRIEEDDYNKLFVIEAQKA